MPHFLSVMIVLCLILIIREIPHMGKAAALFISSHLCTYYFTSAFSWAFRTEMHH